MKIEGNNRVDSELGIIERHLLSLNMTVGGWI